VVPLLVSRGETFSIAFLRRFRKGNYGAVEEQLTEEGEIIPQASGAKRNVENPDGMLMVLRVKLSIVE